MKQMTRKQKKGNEVTREEKSKETTEQEENFLLV